MIRSFVATLLALPIAAALVPASAAAQDYQTPNYRNAQRVDQQNLPPPAMSQDNQQGPAYAPPGAPQRVLPYPEEEEAAVPPPGYGRQYGAQPPAGGPPPAVNGDPNAIRPPGAVGAAPAATPQPVPAPATAVLPPEDQPEQGQPKALPPNLQRQLVKFSTKEPAGTIVIDTPNTYLYLVLGHGQALRYGIGVGREGFTWAGTERISRMKDWPDWFPPPEMIERQPYLPRMMAGGPGNPLGARALYLGHTLYRIHGTNQPSTIGQTVSSGCIRLLNEDIEDLFSRVQVGSRVVVLPGQMPPQTAAINATGANPPPASAPNGAPPPTINGITGKPLPPIR